MFLNFFDGVGNYDGGEHLGLSLKGLLEHLFIDRHALSDVPLGVTVKLHRSVIAVHDSAFIADTT